MAKKAVKNTIARRLRRGAGRAGHCGGRTRSSGTRGEEVARGGGPEGGGHEAAAPGRRCPGCRGGGRGEEGDEEGHPERGRG
jgi:hypothetical protein